MIQTMHNNGYGLSIRFSSDGFSLFITDEKHNHVSRKIVSGKIYDLSETEIIDLLSKQSEIQLNYQWIRIICETSFYTIIPYVFFKKDEVEYMLKFQHPELEKNSSILYNFLEIWDAANVFSIPKTLFDVIRQFLPEITIEHHLTTFLTDHVALHNEKCLHIWIRAEHMDVVVLNGNNLQLINTFEYTTSEDFTYHVMNAILQLGLNPEECKVFLYNSDQAHKLSPQIGQFVASCSIMD